MSTTTPTEADLMAEAMARAAAETSSDDEPTTNHDSPESELDDVEQQVAMREWAVSGEYEAIVRQGGQILVEKRSFEKTYWQKPLSFAGMLEFTRLLGEKISEAMSGPDGLTVDGVFSEGKQALADGQLLLAREDFSSVDAFVKGLARLASYAPTLIEECQCIWLRVPLHERPIVKQVWSNAPGEGGLRASEGSEMLDVFLGQNYEEVEDFFVVQLPALAKRVTKLRQLASLRSRRSRSTQARTVRRSRS